MTEKPRIICRFFGRNPIKAPELLNQNQYVNRKKNKCLEREKTVRTTNKRVIILCGHEVNSNMSNCLKNTVIFRLEIKPFKIDLYFFFFYGFRVNVLFAIKDIIKRIRKPCNFRYSSKSVIFIDDFLSRWFIHQVDRFFFALPIYKLGNTLWFLYMFMMDRKLFFTKDL